MKHWWRMNSPGSTQLGYLRPFICTLVLFATRLLEGGNSSARAQTDLHSTLSSEQDRLPPSRSMLFVFFKIQSGRMVLCVHANLATRIGPISATDGQ